MNLNKGKLISNVEDHSVLLGQYISDTHSTVRSTAKKFGVSKSTVHMVITK